jgi:hypothetical protein
MFNATLQICCQSHLHETPWPMFDGALRFLVARARVPWPCSMKLCNFVASRTRERPLAMFNATLQICCQSHLHETPWPMFDGALRFLVARARGPWPCSMELCSFAASHARARPLADVRLNVAIRLLESCGLVGRRGRLDLRRGVCSNTPIQAVFATSSLPPLPAPDFGY